MTILCGTDFSTASLEAVRAAACFAVRARRPLHLVHCIAEGTDAAFGATRAELERGAQRRLEAVAAECVDAAVAVRCEVVFGTPDEALAQAASRAGATLLVVGALGQRKAESWQLGSHAERLAHHCAVPVFVVRSARPFQDWVQQNRALRVLIGADFSLSGEAAIAWLTALAAFGPCEVTLAHMYWPPDQFARLGLLGVRSYVEPDPVVTAVLERDFGTRLTALREHAQVRIHVEPHIGGVGSRLAMLGGELGSDLIVVGTHGRGPMERVLHGSVSHVALHCAQSSVVCVPAPAQVLQIAPRAPRCVVVATDFSPAGDAAVALGYSLVANGGNVHLVHVVEERGRFPTDAGDIFTGSGDVAGQAPARELLSRVMRDGPERSLRSRVHVLCAADTATAICQAAERLDAGLICVGTHGRAALRERLMGSVAQGVVRRTTRPVLLARAPQP